MTFGLRIRVDFNNRLADGSVLGSLRRATGDFQEGDVVVAMQPGEGMEHFARVLSIDEQNGRVALEVNWQSDPSEWAPASGARKSLGVEDIFVPANRLYRFAPADASFGSACSFQRVPIDAAAEGTAPQLSPSAKSVSS